MILDVIYRAFFSSNHFSEVAPNVNGNDHPSRFLYNFQEPPVRDPHQCPLEIMYNCARGNWTRERVCTNSQSKSQTFDFCARRWWNSATAVGRWFEDRLREIEPAHRARKIYGTDVYPSEMEYLSKYLYICIWVTQAHICRKHMHIHVIRHTWDLCMVRVCVCMCMYAWECVCGPSFSHVKISSATRGKGRTVEWRCLLPTT